MKRPYKDCISDAHVGEFRKTRHLEKVKGTQPFPFKRIPTKRVINAKRRPCVHARLMKLTKYVRRAWAGYSFGELK